MCKWLAQVLPNDIKVSTEEARLAGKRTPDCLVFLAAHRS